MILQLGSRTVHSNTGDNSWLGDYKLVAKGPGYAMWVNRTTPLPTDISSQQSAVSAQPEKFIENGQLFIRCGEQVYDMFGNKIKN